MTVPDRAQSSDHRHVAAINDSLVINVDFARTSSQSNSKPASNDAPSLTKQKNESVSGTVNTEQSKNEQTSPRNSAKQEDTSEVHDEDRRIEIKDQGKKSSTGITEVIKGLGEDELLFLQEGTGVGGRGEEVTLKVLLPVIMETMNREIT